MDGHRSRIGVMPILAAILGVLLLTGCSALRGDGLRPTPEIGPASWRLDPAWDAPDAEAVDVHLLIEEYACSSGSSPAGRVVEPRVEYGPTSVAITVSVHAVVVREGEGVNCQGNPEFPITVHLDQALAGRSLVDPNARPEG